jgi:voltage-gated potassium channel
MKRPDELRALRLRLAIPLIALLTAAVSGTVGYRWLWRDIGGTWLDALFMTFTTLTTIGYGEVKPLNSAGRYLTMAVGGLGIASLFYLFGVVMDFVVSRELAVLRGGRRMQKQIDALSGHYIVAGLGRVGRQAVAELESSGVSFVVVDPSEAVAEFAGEREVLFLRGDATEDEVLQRAGIRRATGLIVTTNNDATNLYVVLSARLLNPNLFIVSRADEESSIPKLTRAGANRAISPYAIGGRRLAHLMLSPGMVEFFDTTMRKGNKALSIGDLLLEASSPAVGQTIERLHIAQRTGATVLALVRDGGVIATPRGEQKLAQGDRLLALGTDEQIQQLQRMLQSGG